MGRAGILMLATAIAVIFAAPAQGLHCNGTILTIDAGGETFYFDDRSDAAGDIDYWLYLESNGIEGLQSGADDIICKDCSPLPFAVGDPCAHAVPDTLIL